MKMEYRKQNILPEDNTHKYTLDQTIWFRVHNTDVLLAGIVKDVYYRIQVNILDNRIKVCHPSGEHGFTLSKSDIISLSTDSHKDVGDIMIIDISVLGNHVREICDSFDGRYWSWDNPHVLGRIITCEPIYRIYGQYQVDQPSILEVESECQGEMYGNVDEDQISVRSKA